MTNTNIRRLVYHIRHNYVTMNNLVVLVAFLIAASWAWGSIGVLQKNYTLQKVVDEKRARAKLIELQAETLVYEQKYYRSTEYQELAVRERMGLALPGERVLILPPNSAAAKGKSQAVALGSSSSKQSIEPDNLQQWVNFLFGGSRTVQNNKNRV
jgi:hypothetical protein